MVLLEDVLLVEVSLLLLFLAVAASLLLLVMVERKPPFLMLSNLANSKATANSL